jgi:hypothetical protein
MRLRNIALAGALALTLSNAQSALFDRGGGLIYDDVENLTWLKDAYYAYNGGFSSTGKMTWQAGMTWAANMTFQDSVRGVSYSDWRLPTAGNFTTLFYELGGRVGSSIYGEHNGNFDLFRNIQNGDSYWSATELAQQPDFYAVMFSFQTGMQIGNGKRDNQYVWAVRDGDVAYALPPVIDPPPIVVIDPPSIAPIPEPETYVMMLAGLGLLGVFARRRKRNG